MRESTIVHNRDDDGGVLREPDRAERPAIPRSSRTDAPCWMHPDRPKKSRRVVPRSKGDSVPGCEGRKAATVTAWLERSRRKDPQADVNDYCWSA